MCNYTVHGLSQKYSYTYSILQWLAYKNYSLKRLNAFGMYNINTDFYHVYG